jgi:hypothetical protein
MEIIREKLVDIKTSLEALEERILEKPISNSMVGKTFIYRLNEAKRDVALIEKLLGKLDEVERKYPEVG